MDEKKQDKLKVAEQQIELAADSLPLEEELEMAQLSDDATETALSRKEQQKRDIAALPKKSFKELLFRKTEKPNDLDAADARKRILGIVWPSFLELFLTSLASMVDMMMAGRLGSWAITSIGLSTQPRFLMLTTFFALNSGATALVARARGADNRREANLVMRQAVLMTTVLSIIIAALGFFFARPLISLMGAQEQLTLDGGTAYFQIQCIGFVGVAITLCITAVLRGVGNTRVPMVYNMVSNLVNVFFNYCLIYGNLGFPRMEVAGASLATVIGQLTAFAFAVIYILRSKGYLQFRFRDGVAPNLPMIKRIANIGLPALLEQVLLRIGMMVFSLMIASLGTTTFATHQVVMNIQQLSFMNGQAFGIGATTLIGQNLGRNRPDHAEYYAMRCRRYGMMVSLLLAFVFFFFGETLAALYVDEIEVITMAALILKILAINQPMQSSQFIISGGLRGAGDTRSTAIIQFIGSIVVRPLLGLLFIYGFKWGLIGGWIAISIDQVVRYTAALIRFNMDRWKVLQV